MIISAVAENGVIGKDNDLPWHCPTDFAFFKAETVGKPLIMGRRTFESIGKPLPNRRNIVVTRNADFAEPGTERASDLGDAIEMAGDAPEIMIGGGGAIYREAMDLADRLVITRIHASPEGDTLFPEIDPGVWEKTSSRTEQPGPRDSHAMTFEIWDRK